MALTQIQKNIIAGSLLGDGNLQTGSKGKTWRYRALHKHVHMPYLVYKYEVLKEFCTTGPIYGEVFDDRTQRTTERNYFNTTIQASFRYYANMFYTYDPVTERWVKDVPKNVDQILNPQSLAIFYQDDGAVKQLQKSNAMRICTESFSYDGVNRIKASIEGQFGLKVKVGPKVPKDLSKGYRIYIPEKSSSGFASLIKPYLVDCMKYKVTDGKYGHL